MIPRDKVPLDKISPGQNLPRTESHRVKPFIIVDNNIILVGGILSYLCPLAGGILSEGILSRGDFVRGEFCLFPPATNALRLCGRLWRLSMELLTHVSVSRFVSIALPGRSISTRHGVGRTDVITLHEARIGGRVGVVTSVAAIAEVIYSIQTQYYCQPFISSTHNL